MVACTPHPGFGTVRFAHVAVDLATCKHPSGLTVVLRQTEPTVRVTTDSQSIVFKGKVVLTIHENHKGFPAGSPGPIMLEGVSPNGKWILYAIDPMGSASLAADGLQLRAVSVTSGRSFPVAFGLLADGYRAWCNGKLFMTAGGDRITTHDKWLIVAGPPDWRTRVLAKDPKTAYGALACAPNGVVVESAPATGLNMNARSQWSIWRVGLDGTRTRLTTPPKGVSDESPRVLGSTVYFVRGESLFALRGGKVVGPLLQMPHRDQYFGHAWWDYTVTR